MLIRNEPGLLPSISILRPNRLVRRPGSPLHEQLRRIIQDAIVNHFEIGSPFYSEGEIAKHFQISKITVRRAISDLSAEGYITRRHGTSSVVSLAHRPLSGNLTRSEPKNVERNVAFELPSVKPTTKILGLIASELGDGYVGMMMGEIERTAIAAGIQVRCYAVPTIKIAAELAVEFSKQSDLQSFALLASTEVMRFLNLVLLGHGRKTISIDSALLDENCPYIMTDSRAAVQLGFEHLLSLGHRRITLLVHEYPEHPTVRVKIERFRELAAESGLGTSANVFVPDFSQVVGTEPNWGAMDQLWDASYETPTAIMTVSDFGAWSTLDWLHAHGLHVPGDVSVLGFENLPTSQFTRPKLTTVAHPMRAIAKRIIEVLWSESYEPNLHELIQPHLVLRESTGPAK